MLKKLFNSLFKKDPDRFLTTPVYEAVTPVKYTSTTYGTLFVQYYPPIVRQEETQAHIFTWLEAKRQKDGLYKLTQKTETHYEDGFKPEKEEDRITSEKDGILTQAFNRETVMATFASASENLKKKGFKSTGTLPKRSLFG